MNVDSDIDRREDACRRYELSIRALGARVADRTHTWWLYDDILQAGRLALMECLDAHDPAFRTAFWTFAHRRITGAMVDEIRRLYPGSRVLRNGHMHVPFDSVNESMISDGDTFDLVSGTEEREWMMEAMQRLMERERYVVMLYSHGMYLHQIGTLMGCSESRACQIYKRAIRKMRRGMEQGRPRGGPRAQSDGFPRGCAAPGESDQAASRGTERRVETAPDFT